MKARARFWSHHDRATYECPSCGRDAQEAEGPWHVHHKDRDPLNNEYVNLVGVCIWCHRKGHRLDSIMREMNEWKEQFRQLGGST
jgi:hypothetical protein